MKLKVMAIISGMAAVIWMLHPLFLPKEQVHISHPVSVAERDVETLVYGYDNGTDFVPGVYTGDLVISPEEAYYNSVELMARCVEAEAGNQGLLGKRLVADVILNRVRDDDFPDTIVDVIYQENAFAVVGNGMIDKVEPTEETWKAVNMELERVSYPDLFYFCSIDFHEYGNEWLKVEDHYFNTK